MKSHKSKSLLRFWTSAALGALGAAGGLTAAVPALAQRAKQGPAPSRAKAAPAQPETPGTPNAADAPEAAAPAGKDPQAVEVLRSMYDFQNKLGSYSFTGRIQMKMEAQGMMMNMPMDMTIRVQKPNRMFAKTTGQGMAAVSSMTTVSDGKTMTVYMPASNSYFEQPAPAEITEAPGGMSPMGGGMGSPVGGNVPTEVAMKKLVGAEYLGLEEVKGVQTHHVRSTSKEGKFNMTMEMWIEAGPRPVVRRAIPDFSNFGEMVTGMLGGDAADPTVSDAVAGMKMQSTIDYDNWEFNPKFPPETFVFTPPPGAEKTDADMMGMLGGGGLGGLGGGGADAVDKADASLGIIGKPAPNFTAKLTDGREVGLLDARGKALAVVFWATWSKPSADVMRKVGEAATLAGSGAATLFIDQIESADEVSAFLAKNAIKGPTALDENGEIGALYDLTKLPMVVVIDAVGNVSSVFTPDALGADFQSDLKTALRNAAGAKPESKPEANAGAGAEEAPAKAKSPTQPKAKAKP